MNDCMTSLRWHAIIATICIVPASLNGMEALKTELGKLYNAVTGKRPNFTSVFSRGQGKFTTPNDEADTSFFGMLAEEQTQREHWYAVTPYSSEFWCSLSNLGFLYVGHKHGSARVFGAGLASMFYHSYPKQWALWLDRIGAAAGISLMFEHRATIWKHMGTLAAPIGIALAALVADVNLFGQSEMAQPWVHALWHLSAAYAADRILTAVNNEQQSAE